MRIVPLLVQSIVSSTGLQLAAGEPHADTGWRATSIFHSTSEPALVYSLMLPHYVAHNLLWAYHLYRAIQPDSRGFALTLSASVAVIVIGNIANIICVVPTPQRGPLDIPLEAEWLFAPIANGGASGYVLPRIAWSWLICQQLIVYNSEMYTKLACILWIAFDSLTLLILRATTLPALATTALLTAWVYRRFGWPSQTHPASGSRHTDAAAAPAPTSHVIRSARFGNQYRAPTADVSNFDHDALDQDDEDDEIELPRHSAVFEIGTPDKVWTPKRVRATVPMQSV